MSSETLAAEQISASDNQLLRTLVNSLPDSIFVKDRQSRFLISNLAHARTLGVAHPDEVAGKTDLDFFPPKVASQRYADEQALMKLGQAQNREESLVDPQNGETRWLQTTKAPLHDKEGKVVGLVSISRDITKRKQAEDALRQARLELQQKNGARAETEGAPAGGQGQLQVLLDNLPDRICFKDTQSRFIQCNQAFARFLGLADPQLAVGKTEYDFLPAERAKESYQDEQKIIRNGQPLINKVEKQTAPDGKVTWTSVTKLPVRDPAGVMMGVAGFARDITDLKRAENELEQMHKQLLETSRMAGKAEVATGVLHNVANVINSVNVAAATVSERLRTSKVAGVSRLAKLFQEQSNDLGHFFTEDERGRRVPAYLEQLAEHLEQEQAELGKELEGLVHNVEHIKEIVTTQQNYERVAGVTEKVTLPDLVEDALRIHGGAYERHGVTVVREFDPLPPILVDKHKVLQILVNLFSNAKYACEEGGNKNKQVTVRIRAAGEERVAIEVADNGMGIAPENQGRIFSQGFTTRKDGHGFGLRSGAVAAQELGGSLAVQSAGAGQGATFTLELPVTPPPDPPN